jgi:hypothetical protein
MPVNQDRWPSEIVVSTGTEANIITATQYPQKVGHIVFSSDTFILYVAKSTAGGGFTPIGTTLPYVAKTATYTITDYDYTIDCTANTFTVTLPTAVGITGRIYIIKNSGAGVITVDADGTETIDGGANVSLATQYDSVTVQSDGANWIITSRI